MTRRQDGITITEMSANLKMRIMCFSTPIKYPNVKSVKDLIYKKDVVRVGKERIPLTDNNIMEQELGKHNIICIEDIANEVVSVGSHFKAVNSFLCPFVLNYPKKTLQGKKKRFEDGGDSGNRKDHINEFINKMN